MGFYSMPSWGSAGYDPVSDEQRFRVDVKYKWE